MKMFTKQILILITAAGFVTPSDAQNAAPPVAPAEALSSADPIQPIWVVKKEADWKQAGKLGPALFLTTTKDSPLIFYFSDRVGKKDQKGFQMVNSLTVALVERRTGKVTAVTPLHPPSDETNKQVAGHTLTPDGRLILCTIHWRKEPSDQRARAHVVVTSLDTSTGKIVAQTKWHSTTRRRMPNPAPWDGFRVGLLKWASVTTELQC